MSVISAAPNSDKGARYFAQLDHALCNAAWPEVPELARKTEKHAPQRQAFTLAARSEAQIASIIPQSDPQTTSLTASIDSLGELRSKLKDAASNNGRYPEDTYVAAVCLAEMYWLQKKYLEALEVLPQAGRPSTSSSSHAVPLGWLEVCEVKADFINISALAETGRSDEARQLGLQVASRTPGSRTAELRRWTERLLAKVCLIANQRTGEHTLQSLSQALRCFNAWADFWQRSSPGQSSASSAVSSQIDIPRRLVWRAYYALVSVILQHGLLYNLHPKSSSDLLMPFWDDDSDEGLVNVRSRQRSALRRVEVRYEALLLDETLFPKSSLTNAEIEEWVQLVVSNWTILSGPTWPEAALGEGGKESLARGVLDILYRAATKTYHSTPILRHLFTVHAAVGEFDLAMHAFHSYVEIVSKGKARVEKTGEVEAAVDSDELAILTAVEVVRVLCRYGDREQCEKAVEVGNTIKKWIAKVRPLDQDEADATTEDGRTAAPIHPTRIAAPQLDHKTIGAAHRAIGIGQAQWARLTYETHVRSELREDALKHLRMAARYDMSNIETAYALALLLAESRNVSASTSVLKSTIAQSASIDDDESEDGVSDWFGRERMLLPVWHLLALCLTAQDGYEQALRMCEAAFEQFGDTTALFGEGEQRTSITDDEKVSESRSRIGIVDQMEGYEKETLLLIRMSQITLLELMEGVEAAVDASYELLGLYARLFGSPQFSRPTYTPQPPSTAISATPSKLGGTLRSIAGSIRPKSARQSMSRDPRIASTVSVPALLSINENGAEPETKVDDNAGVPISITVTNENGIHTENSRHHRHMPFRRRGEFGSIRTNRSSTSVHTTGETYATPIISTSIPDPTLDSAESRIGNQPEGVAGDPEKPFDPVAHNAQPNTWPPPTGHDEQPPRQDTRLPAPHPPTGLVPDARLPTAQDRRQRISLLVKIWLFTAGLYLRAELFEDAGSAVDEAKALAESFEAEVGGDHSSARNFLEKGWGGGQSVDSLWADIWSAKGYLAVARNVPFEALDDFEQALIYSPDHVQGIVGISNLLMDIYEQKIPAQEPERPLAQQPSASSSALNTGIPPAPKISGPAKSANAGPKSTPHESGRKDKINHDLAPAELNRLAARDRAYMLLTNLTRLGSGWDNAEAWSTLARAHELSKQVSKAKDALWWVVELEENEPMRPWCEVSAGGYTL